MKVFLIALIASFLFAVAFAGTSCPAADKNSLSAVCTDVKNAYCLMVNTDIVNPVYECRACLTNCDCTNNQYCSSSPSTIGTCVTFNKNGKSCRPLSPAQLVSTDYPDAWKCAITFSVNNVVAIDAAGVCIEEKCRYCAPGSGSGGLGTCSYGTGLKNDRVCVYPGALHQSQSKSWVEGEYYQTPENVWWAIFFVFFIILIIIQLVQCFLLMKS